jgi:hypothetical protein
LDTVYCDVIPFIRDALDIVGTTGDREYFPEVLVFVEVLFEGINHDRIVGNGIDGLNLDRVRGAVVAGVADDEGALVWLEAIAVEIDLFVRAAVRSDAIAKTAS